MPYVPRTRTGYYGSRVFKNRRAPGSYVSRSRGLSVYAARSRFASVKMRARQQTGTLRGCDFALNTGAIETLTPSENTGSITLNAITSGAGYMNRVGRKILCKSIRLKGNFKLTFTHDSGATFLLNAIPSLRMVVVWDKRPGDSRPLWNEIFGWTVADGTEDSNNSAHPRFDNMQRFQILRDHTYNIGQLIGGSVPDVQGSAGGQQYEHYVPFDEYIDLKGRETTFSSDSAAPTVADISTGALYVYWRCPSGITSVTGNTISYAVEDDSLARLRFTT